MMPGGCCGPPGCVNCVSGAMEGCGLTRGEQRFSFPAVAVVECAESRSP